MVKLTIRFTQNAESQSITISSDKDGKICTKAHIGKCPTYIHCWCLTLQSPRLRRWHWCLQPLAHPSVKDICMPGRFYLYKLHELQLSTDFVHIRYVPSIMCDSSPNLSIQTTSCWEKHSTCQPDPWTSMTACGGTDPDGAKIALKQHVNLQADICLLQSWWWYWYAIDVLTYSSVL